MKATKNLTYFIKQMYMNSTEKNAVIIATKNYRNNLVGNHHRDHLKTVVKH